MWVSAGAFLAVFVIIIDRLRGDHRASTGLDGSRPPHRFLMHLTTAQTAKTANAKIGRILRIQGTKYGGKSIMAGVCACGDDG